MVDALPGTLTAGRAAARHVDVVIPATHELQRALRSAARVLAARNVTPHSIVVVIAAALGRELASTHDVLAGVDVVRARSDVAAEILQRALALHAERDVVVLQPGTEVHGDWLDRLAAHAGEAGCGVVGAFTNMAGAAIYAGTKENAGLPAGWSSEKLDQLFAHANSCRSTSVACVHGPCIYFVREAIDAAGTFRAFQGDDGRAALIDIAVRIRDAGFETRIAGDVFVGFDEASGTWSLPLEASPARSALAHLHPSCAKWLAQGDVDSEVALLAGRVDIARLAASSQPTIVFVSHAWGGGIRRHMDDLRALLRGRANVLYIEPAGEDTIKLHAPDDGDRFAAWFRLPEDLALLASTLRAIGVVRLHYHHVHDLPRAILDLPSACGVAYDCTLHDYYAICPQYHLAGRDGRFCGEPDEAGCAACVGERPIQWGLDVAGWRALLGAFVRGAARVIAPSGDVAARIGRQLPGLAVDVWPHPEASPPSLPRIVRVVTLGNLSREKGLDVVARCAAVARRDALPLAIRVLGATTEPIAQSPEVPLTIHGSYAEYRLGDLLAGERADVVWFPAQVPETYSYTLSIALASGLPIVASDIGAFPERLANHAHAHLLRWDAVPEAWIHALLDAAGLSRNGT